MVKSFQFPGIHQYGDRIQRICFPVRIAGQFTDVLFLNLRYYVPDPQPLFHCLNSFNKCLCPFCVGHILAGDACGNGQIMKLFVDGRSIGFQHERKQDGIGKAVGDAVFTSQGMGNGMDIPHIRFGKSPSCMVGGNEHLFTGFWIQAVLAGFIYIGKN